MDDDVTLAIEYGCMTTRNLSPCAGFFFVDEYEWKWEVKYMVYIFLWRVEEFLIQTKRKSTVREKRRKVIIL